MAQGSSVFDTQGLKRYSDDGINSGVTRVLDYFGAGIREGLGAHRRSLKSYLSAYNVAASLNDI